VTNDELTEALMGLFEKGFINVSYDENLEPKFEITEEGQQMMEKWKER
jgi:DNA-binding PadR family transcriptional regulator